MKLLILATLLTFGFSEQIPEDHESIIDKRGILGIDYSKVVKYHEGINFKTKTKEITLEAVKPIIFSFKRKIMEHIPSPPHFLKPIFKPEFEHKTVHEFEHKSFGIPVYEHEHGFEHKPEFEHKPVLKHEFSFGKEFHHNVHFGEEGHPPHYGGYQSSESAAPTEEAGDRRVSEKEVETKPQPTQNFEGIELLNYKTDQETTDKRTSPSVEHEYGNYKIIEVGNHETNERQALPLGHETTERQTLPLDHETTERQYLPLIHETTERQYLPLIHETTERQYLPFHETTERQPLPLVEGQYGHYELGSYKIEDGIHETTEKQASPSVEGGYGGHHETTEKSSTPLVGSTYGKVEFQNYKTDDGYHRETTEKQSSPLGESSYGKVEQQHYKVDDGHHETTEKSVSPLVESAYGKFRQVVSNIVNQNIH